MKHLLHITFLIFSAFVLHGQQINLQVGDEFEFNRSVHSTSYSRYPDKSQSNINREGFENQNIKFTVKEKLEDSYLIGASIHIGSEYERIKKEEEEANWSTSKSYYDYLTNDSLGIKKISDCYIEFRLFFDGQVSNIRMIDSSAAYKQMIDFSKFFFPVLSKMKIGQTINRNNVKYKLVGEKDRFLEFEGKSDNNGTLVKKLLKVNKNNGLLLDEIDNVEIRNNAGVHNVKHIGKVKFLFDKTSTIRTSFIQKDKTPFKCKFRKDLQLVDTTLVNTNVRIRGKIKHPCSGVKTVHLEWDKSLPHVTNKYQVITNLMPDNTFEIRTSVDKLTKVRLFHGEYATFYILPGDDLYIEVDLDFFDETIKASGIGAEHVNFMFQRYLEIELTKDTITRYRSDFPNVTPEKLKKQSLDWMRGRHAFLSNYMGKMAPEVYLAAFWYIKIYPAEKLNDYRNYYIVTHKEMSDARYLNFSYIGELQHPGNDLMSFYEEYPDFISKYFDYSLRYGIEKLIGGGGKLDLLKNTLHDPHGLNYQMAHGFYSGVSRYILKYETVRKALIQDDWGKFLVLYDQFIKEYPDTEHSQMLSESYKRAEAVLPGQLAYNFELEDLNGNTVELSDFKGKAVYLLFWELGKDSEMIKNYGKRLCDKFKSKNIQIVFAAFRPSSARAEFLTGQVRIFLDSLSQKIGGTKLLVNEEKEINLKNEFFIVETPHFSIIDTKGRIVNNKACSPNLLLNNPDELTKALDPDWIVENGSSIVNLLKFVIFSLLGLIIVGLVVVLIYRRTTTRKLKLANLNTKVRDLELTAIRAQMNPHFMYNCLNSIQNLIQKYQMEEAHSYISKFASMTRGVLKHSSKEEISLAEELDMLSEYVSLEQLRVSFEYEVSVDNEVDAYSVFIPPLLLQPIVENAIVHGLTPKEGDKQLSVGVRLKDEKVCISIVDNGIGRKASSRLSKATTGNGLKFSEERLNLLGDKYEENYNLEVKDVLDEGGKVAGTSVIIYFSFE